MHSEEQMHVAFNCHIAALRARVPTSQGGGAGLALRPARVEHEEPDNADVADTRLAADAHRGDRGQGAATGD